MVRQYGHLHRLRDYRDIDPTMGPTVSGTYARTRFRSRSCACARLSVQWDEKIPHALGPPGRGHATALLRLPLLPGYHRLYYPHRLGIGTLGRWLSRRMLCPILHRDNLAILFHGLSIMHTLHSTRVACIPFFHVLVLFWRASHVPTFFLDAIMANPL